MSRFFKGAEDSSSESESESSSGDEKNIEQPRTAKAPARTYDSSSEDDGAPAKRVVQSQQAKLAQEYDLLVNKIKLHIKANEFKELANGIFSSHLYARPSRLTFSPLLTPSHTPHTPFTITCSSTLLIACIDLVKLDKALQKSEQRGDAVPRAYTKALCMLEDHVTKTKDSAVKLNKSQQSGFKYLKETLKKHNAPYQSQIAEYRKVYSRFPTRSLALFSVLSYLCPSYLISNIHITEPRQNHRHGCRRRIRQRVHGGIERGRVLGG